MIKTTPEIMHNCRVKVYPGGYREVLVASAPVFRERGWELSDKWDSEPKSKGEAADKAANISRAKRRAKSAVHEIALANDFMYFVTWTIDKDKLDRYDITQIQKPLNQWLDNRVRRNGLKYVVVPELHKDGAVHFHGLINDAIDVVDSGTLSHDGGRPFRPRSERQRACALADGAHVVYNIPGWRYGFSTAIELYGDRERAVNYVCKYITKAQAKIGGRWYLSGGELMRPEIQLSDVEFEDFCDVNDGYCFHVDALGADMVQFTLRG